MIVSGAKQAASEAIFGSAARGTLDFLSDRDYLVVDDCPYLRFDRRVTLERQGWSVAPFSWSRLKSLVAKRALFVQHLKQEALIVCDRHDRLKHELSLFTPKPSYAVEIAETASLITATTANINSKIERAWASDVLAVAVRNLAILSLAEQGQYLFDYDDVVSFHAKLNGIGTGESQILKNLRRYKAFFRTGDLSKVVSSAELKTVCSTVAYLTGGAHFSDYGERTPFTYPRHLAPYVSQRLVERDLLVSVRAPNVDCDEYSTARQRVLRRIVSPRDYGWEFSHTESQLWADVEWLKNHSVIVQSQVAPTGPRCLTARPIAVQDTVNFNRIPIAHNLLSSRLIKGISERAWL